MVCPHQSSLKTSLFAYTALYQMGHPSATLLQLGKMWLSADHILQVGGLLAVTLIIFAESGLLVVFFFPGDPLLIPAGTLASHNKLNIYILLPALTLAAIIGYQVGYAVGKHAGPRVF